ncbi:MAG: peptidoglycan-associated lipoprotein Pal [Nitrospinae bacterium]|nr:peptidoglycan-associated lipoprotein Pal [Nitrospinota bacterium]
MILAQNKLFRVLVGAIALVGLTTLGACSSDGSKDAAGGAGGAGAAGSGADNPEGSVPGGMADASALVDVYFDFDKSEIRSDAREALAKNAEWLIANKSAQVQIEGHCDERGTEEYNLALGERRANAVKDYLASLGVESARLYTISYGEELPVDPGHTDEAWSKNRRAHFLVTAQ